MRLPREVMLSQRSAKSAELWEQEKSPGSRDRIMVFTQQVFFFFFWKLRCHSHSKREMAKLVFVWVIVRSGDDDFLRQKKPNFFSLQKMRPD